MSLFGFLGKEENYENKKSQGAKLEDRTIDFKDSGDSSKNFKYLDDLIQSGQNEIVLNSDIVLSDDEESEYADGIKIEDKNIVIEGNFHTIDAKCKTRIFNITGSDISFNNLKFQNANDINNGGFGGAIRLTESDCKIYNCEFRENKIENNRNSGSGGAIWSFDSNLKVQNSIFNANFAGYHGGAIHSEINHRNFSGNNDKKVTGEKIRLDIANCQFNDNVVQNGEACGGAICIRGSLVNIVDSKFNNNKCDSVGGAIDNDGILTISNCKFTNNFADYPGGAICNYDYETQYVTLDISDSTFDSNKSNNFGGAIDNMNGGLSVKNSKFLNNSSKYGGAISTIKGNDYYSVDIEDCIFENNSPDDTSSRN